MLLGATQVRHGRAWGQPRRWCCLDISPLDAEQSPVRAAFREHRRRHTLSTRIAEIDEVNFQRNEHGVRG